MREPKGRLSKLEAAAWASATGTELPALDCARMALAVHRRYISMPKPACLHNPDRTRAASRRRTPDGILYLDPSSDFSSCCTMAFPLDFSSAADVSSLSRSIRPAEATPAMAFNRSDSPALSRDSFMSPAAVHASDRASSTSALGEKSRLRPTSHSDASTSS